MDGLSSLFDGAALRSLAIAAASCLAMAPLLPGIAAAIPPRYPDAASFIRGISLSMVAIPGRAQAGGAEEVASRCLAAIAGAQGTEAFSQAVVRAQGTFRLSSQQETAFTSCIAQAGYRFREPDPVPPGSRRIY